MKRTILISIAITLSLGAEAQKLKEWFQQKKTQKEYLLKQIAALEVYLDYLKEGYDIVQKGLTIVGDIKGENFNDHSEYFSSLKLVNADLGVNGKVYVIIARQVAIMTMFRKLNSECRNNDYLTSDEIQYVGLVYENLLIECERSIDVLDVVITNEAAQMTDEARIERIDEVYDDLNDKYAFARTFCSSARTLIMQRASEKNEVEYYKKLNDVL